MWRKKETGGGSKIIATQQSCSPRVEIAPSTEPKHQRRKMKRWRRDWKSISLSYESMRRKEKKRKGGRKRIKRGGRERNTVQTGMKNRIDSWISRARIYTIDKIFLEPPWFSTSWKISWNGKLRAFGKEETSFRVDGIGIDSALGATILFNSRNADIDCRDCCSPSTVHRVSRSSINQTNCRPRHLIACFEIRDAHPSHAFLQHLRSGGWSLCSSISCRIWGSFF